MSSARHNLSNLGSAATKASLITREGHMVNDRGKLCVIGYHNLGNLGCTATKATHIEREGHMVNNKGVRCITGYKNLGDASKVAHIEREGYVVNNKGVRCITAGYKNMSKEGVRARDENARATALGEHHSHMCTSALCQRGASIKLEGGLPRLYHH